MSLRNNKGQFKKGNQGFWYGKKRPNLSQENNPKWVGYKNNHICIICSKVFRRATPTSGKPRYCSMNCYGKSKLTTHSRNRRIYKEWMQAILKRDSYTCQICKSKKSLITHHIKTFKKYPELRTELSNGMTLCRPCHNKVHYKDIHNSTKILNDYMPNIPKG